MASSSKLDEEWDVIVVGAGPAGGLSALAPAQAGLRTLILEKRPVVGLPIQCGEYMPENEEIKAMLPRVREIDAIFDFPASLKALECPTITLTSPKKRSYVFDFRGFSTWRNLWDQHFVERSVRAGAVLRRRHNFLGLVNGGGARWRGVEVLTDDGVKRYGAKAIIGCDGPHSLVARSLGFPKQVLTPAASCDGGGKWEPTVQLFFGPIAPGGYAWVIPKCEGANVGVGYQTRFVPQGTNMRQVMRRFLGFIGARESKTTGGYIPMEGPRPRTCAGNVMLAGDAAGHVMATNGGGIPIAMIAGWLAGRQAVRIATKGEDSAPYETEWRRQMGMELETALRIKRMADRFAFRSDLLTEWTMRLLGKKRLERAIRCKPLFGSG
jgi:digeranylgeranylglycerophospholipid reductase